MEVGLTTKVNLFEGLVSERSTRYCYWFQEQSEGVWLSPVKLPDGDWQFAFASPLSPTEEEAAKYVGWAPTDPKLYREYKKDDADSDYYDFTFRTANESLHSRIKSEGFPHPERVVLLTKK